MEDSDVINFSALEKELQSALAADKKYRRENDAKFRAIHQNVGSYEEFRDIVLASHLKPLDKKDKAGAPRKQPWNAIAAGTKQQGSAFCDVIEVSELHPRTAAEFSRDWRRFGGSAPDRYRLLISLGGEGLRRIFSAEIGFGLLGEFLSVLSECLQPGDVTAVVAVLEGMSQTGRFGLNVSFLSQEEWNRCLQLFRRLLGIVGDGIPLTTDEQCTELPGIEGDKVLPKHNETTEWENVEEKLKALMQLYGVQVECLK
ncbi:coiled-coil domain-containing protein 103 [Megalops cyprinoides]|uniref:coiled-coil domain-containing protein 103 n=1 Tax=Megalops cyprinoides TaxID=118141 RepID=UPI001865067B|nr:coiled-coil domain-containing protein 103 [Megalops cyprinoides]